MKRLFKIMAVALFAIGTPSSLFGDVSVLATRNYVNSRTVLHPVTNNGAVVGYHIGVQTNIVLAAAPVKRYALFLVHLNPNSTSHPFADIELKATTNNFYDGSMMFYCSSSVNGDPDRSGNPSWDHDWCRIYILTSQVDTDVRRWRRIRNTTDLGTYNPRELAIIVDPALFRRGQGSEWMAESNDDLIWSYVRMTSSAPEKDEDGTHPLWRPIMPVRWYSELPRWANQASF